MLCGLHASDKALWVIFHKVLQLLDSTVQDDPLCPTILTDTAILKIIAAPENFCLFPEKVCKELKERDDYGKKNQISADT